MVSNCLYLKMCAIYLFLIMFSSLVSGIFYIISFTNSLHLFMSAPDILNTFKGLYAQKAI